MTDEQKRILEWLYAKTRNAERGAESPHITDSVYQRFVETRDNSEAAITQIELLVAENERLDKDNNELASLRDTLIDENAYLKNDNNELRKTICIAEDNYIAIKRERDAAVRDLAMNPCFSCAHMHDLSAKCGDCYSYEFYEWRGVCAENGGNDGGVQSQK